jgi:hypothetical protein
MGPTFVYVSSVSGGDFEHTLCNSLQNLFTRLNEFGSFRDNDL